MSDGAPIVALGFGGLAAAWTARTLSNRAPRPVVDAGRWVWPVPSLGDRRAVISDGWGSARRKADGGTRPHLGADIMFKRRSRTDLVEVHRPGTPNGTRWFFMPDGVPALAIAAGEVRRAKPTRRGFSVVIRHANGWASYYTHLEQLQVKRGDLVEAGQPIGVIGYDPTTRQKIRHLHFELWSGGTRRGVVDPAPYLDAWQRVELEPPAAAPRNGGFTYRPVGRRGEPYPAWVRGLKGKSGVYVIRQAGEVVYVGESHAGRLYATLTRHFQAWRRWKSFWKDQYSEGHDPGLTYPRHSVEVAVRVMSPDDAIDEEARLIQRLRPRDNLLGQPELEEAPF
jgi:hypothetical protein